MQFSRNLGPGNEHGNAFVPFHLRSRFWNAKIDCSHRNGTIAFRWLFLFTRERNRSVPRSLFSSCHFFQQQLHPRLRLGHNSCRSVFLDQSCTSLAVHMGMERSTFLITFLSIHFFKRNDVISSYMNKFKLVYSILTLLKNNKSAVLRQPGIWSFSAAYQQLLFRSTQTRSQF